ncbi:MAG: hypothetical protein HY721_32535 [Planctomycetes bacterium]|nr:hypothetical protein [Planctomycetota bacterium]
MSTGTPDGSGSGVRLLYCHCAYAKVVPPEVKAEVLRRLSESGAAFDAVPDLCDMSARKDPALARIAGSGATRIAACYPRAVKWLFHAAGAPLPAEGVEILNMRTQSAGEVLERLVPPPAAGDGEEARL